MAATVPFSLIMNYSPVVSERAFVVKANNLNLSKLVLPLQCRRLSFSASAANNEQAAVNADNGAPTIFDQIINKEIPSSVVYEDEKVLASRDIKPEAPVHVLVIPKFRDGLTELGKAEARHVEILGDLLLAAKIVAEKEGILDGFRVVINSGPSAYQTVYHLHLHVLGGRQMNWPPC
ncbi:14 kDa zinc-binding protein-like [Gastrolobium bilobum]|uniref:14 kDa zinc-binding protein-like n=1 Tax=Gastrolobium bilobum TaxID=150636 RepID=UPI002AB2B670|nr:14 kDa zinc-binding protein-like [Gastrolobium bilobum]